MKRLLIIALLIASCSSDDSNNDDGCKCETVNFRYPINRNQGIFEEFSAPSCRSFWLNAGYEERNGFIEEVTESNYQDAHNNFYNCN